MNINAKKIFPFYKQLFSKVLEKDFIFDKNGQKIVELLAPNIILDPKELFIDFKTRKSPRKYIETEQKWYTSADLNISQVSQIKIWQDVADNQFEINSNYGNLVYSRNNFSQFWNVLNTLANHKDSRQGIIIYTRPSIHYEWNSHGASDFICFSGDTIVKSPEGDIQIEKLVEKLERNEKYPVYSVNLRTKKREIKWAKRGYRTGKNKIVRVHLDNGEYIDTTKDHIFYTKKINKDHSHSVLEVKASDLKPGNSLWTLMTQKNGKGLCFKRNLNGGNSYDQRVLIHREYYSFYHNDYDLEGYDIHHIDENPLNNSISNLKKMARSEHRKYHMIKDNPVHLMSDASLKESHIKMANTIKSKKYGKNRPLSWYENRNSITYDECILLAKKYLEETNEKLSIRRLIKWSNNKNLYSSNIMTVINHGSNKSFNKFKEHVFENHKITKVEFLDLEKETFDIEVEDNHNFFVGKDGILVHNCTNYQQFFIRDDKLTCVTSMRSNDCWTGTFNDVPWFHLVIIKMLTELQETYSNLSLGDHIFIPNSFHCYEHNFDKLKDLIDNEQI